MTTKNSTCTILASKLDTAGAPLVSCEIDNAEDLTDLVNAWTEPEHERLALLRAMSVARGEIPVHTVDAGAGLLVRFELA